MMKGLTTHGPRGPLMMAGSPQAIKQPTKTGAYRNRRFNRYRYEKEL